MYYRLLLHICVYILYVCFSDGPKMVKVWASSGEDNETTFSCIAKDFYPKDYKIEWLKDDQEITDKNIYEIKTPGNGTLYSAASFLTMQNNDLHENLKFTCHFKGGNKDENSTVIYKPVELCPSKYISNFYYKNIKNILFRFKWFCSSYNCLFIRHSASPPPACSNVVIEIFGPKMMEIFSQRKGTIICKVTNKEQSVERIYWENEDGDEMVDSSKSHNSGGGTTSVSLDITFEEWSQGLKRYCVVIDSSSIEPIRKPYERIPGKKTN